jgi:lipoprotein NlpI
MRICLVSLLCVIAMPFGANAFSTDTELCFTGSGSHRIDIDVCSRALREGTPSPLTRATLLIRRGEAFLTGKVFELALQDFDSALHHNPASSEAHKLRGDTFTKSGNYRAAIKSYDQSLKLNIYAAGTYKGRGLALILSGEFKSAIGNFDNSLALVDTDPETIALRAIANFAEDAYKKAEAGMRDALDRSYPYDFGYLWALAAARLGGNSAEAHIQAALRETDPEIWPGQLIRGVFDPSKETAVRISVTDKNEERHKRRQLQADFYFGLRAMLDDQPTKARRQFTRVANTNGIFDAVEIPVARRLLATLPN